MVPSGRCLWSTIAKDRIVIFFRKFKDFVSLEREVSKKADYLLLSEEAINTRQDIFGDIPHKVALPYILPKSQERSGRYVR